MLRKRQEGTSGEVVRSAVEVARPLGEVTRPLGEVTRPSLRPAKPKAEVKAAEAADRAEAEAVDPAVEALLMHVDTNIKLEDVILSEENEKLVKEFLIEIENQDKLEAHGLYPMNRLLFYGASGCGKTFLGKALSNHLNYKMLYVDIAKALNEGNAAENLSAVFKLARGGSCIIFLDECDSIAWNRNADQNDTGNVRRATNALFQQMDQMNPRTIIVCATNMLHRLDPAFERRFNLKMEFRRPNTDLVETIQNFLYEGFSVENDMDEVQKRIIEGRTNMSFYEIQGVVERAMKQAVISDRQVLKLSDIYKRIAEVMRIKTDFGTAKDKEEIFRNNSKLE